MRYDPLAYPVPDETRIKRSRLVDLERKERAHDAYFRATQRMRERIAGQGPEYARALRDFAELVVEETWQT